MSPDEDVIGPLVDLRVEQERTLSAPPLRANFFLQCMFFSADLFYGRQRTLVRFLVLERLAYCFYQTLGKLEGVDAFILRPDGKNSRGLSARNLVGWIQLGRSGRDTARWHFLLLTDIVRQQKLELDRFRYSFLPAVMVFKYRLLSGILLRLNPVWLLGMMASFESYLEHQYMLLARENSGWDTQAVQSRWFECYPAQRTLGDLIRRLALDQRKLTRTFLRRDADKAQEFASEVGPDSGFWK